MKFTKYLSVMALSLAVSFTSCKKENPEPTPVTPVTTQKGSASINLEHFWGTGNAVFGFNQEFTHPITNDAMTFTTFKYYVSNIKFKKSDGTWYVHPESYFLVDLSNESSSSLSISGIPVGNYTEMKYTLGVDSTRNVSGAQSGALAISNNMFWSWNSGYIMTKIEGTSPNSNSGSFAYHLGGFSGTNSVVAEKTVDLSATNLIISANNESEIHMRVDASTTFNTTGSVSTTNMIHMPGPDAKVMSVDFHSGFTFEHVHN